MATYWENSCSFGLRYVSWYKCLIVNLVFSHLGFWRWNLFLIAPFPDLCLLVPFLHTLWPSALDSIKTSSTYVMASQSKSRLVTQRHLYTLFTKDTNQSRDSHILQVSLTKTKCQKILHKT